jgi:hypothetical protein
VPLLIVSTNPFNMAEPTTPKNSRVSFLESLGRIPSHPTSHFSSSTTVVEARENLVASLTSRMTFNDPKVVDVLVQPHKVDNVFVDKVVDNIAQHQGFTDFFSSLRERNISRESEMYKPLVNPLVPSLRSTLPLLCFFSSAT